MIKMYGNDKYFEEVALIYQDHLDEINEKDIAKMDTDFDNLIGLLDTDSRVSATVFFSWRLPIWMDEASIDFYMENGNDLEKIENFINKVGEVMDNSNLMKVLYRLMNEWYLSTKAFHEVMVKNFKALTQISE